MKKREATEQFLRINDLEIYPKEIKKCKVVISGVGALGSMLVINLAAINAASTTKSKIVIIDRDYASPENFYNSVYLHGDENLKKIDVIYEKAKKINPNINIEKIHADIHQISFQTQLNRLIKWSDIVIDALDNREAKLHLNSKCVMHNKIMLSGGARLDATGMIIQHIIPYKNACLKCRDLRSIKMPVYNKNSKKRRNCMEGSLPCTTGLMANLLLMSLLKFYKGIINFPDYLSYNLVDNVQSIIPMKCNPKCPVCSNFFRRV